MNQGARLIQPRTAWFRQYLHRSRGDYFYQTDYIPELPDTPLVIGLWYDTMPGETDPKLHY